MLGYALMATKRRFCSPIYIVILFSDIRVVDGQTYALNSHSTVPQSPHEHIFYCIFKLKALRLCTIFAILMFNTHPGIDQ